jgi:hypothetical protein
MLGDAPPAALPPSGGSGSNLPALIPGRPYYSGDDGNTFYHSNYEPNWQFGDNGTPGEDEPFNERRLLSLFPNSGGGDSGHGRGLGFSDVLFGSAVLDMGGRIMDAAYGAYATPQDQITEMRLKNKDFTQGDADKAMAAARAMLDPKSGNYVPGMSLTGAMTIIQQGYAQTRDIDTAIAMATPLADAAERMEASGNPDAVNQIFDLQRAAELAGALNHKNADGSVNITPFTNWVNNAATIAQSTPGVELPVKNRSDY